jgi:hypothetical protein
MPATKSVAAINGLAARAVLVDRAQPGSVVQVVQAGSVRFSQPAQQ